VYKILAKRPLRQRIVALAAAYVLVLSSLFANVAAARAAADASAQPIGIICHSDVAGEPSPVGEGDAGKICVDNCCIGCLTLVAAVPPPPAQIELISWSAIHIAGPPAFVSLTPRPETSSHRSRAPPQRA
jgi:hypothetical protein